MDFTKETYAFKKALSNFVEQKTRAELKHLKAIRKISSAQSTFIEENRPRKPGAEKVCPNCEWLALVFDGIIPGGGLQPRLRVYNCSNCCFVHKES